MTTYTTRTEAIATEIVAVIENGDVQDAYAEFDIDKIADQVLTTVGTGTDYRYAVRDSDDFWNIVADNAR